MSTARNAVAVTPHDTNSNRADALYVGTGGDVAILAVGSGSSVTLSNVPDGTFIPIRVVKVLSTGTTASNIVALGL